MAKKRDRLTAKPITVDMDNYPLPEAGEPKTLKASGCRWRVDHTKLGFKTTAEVKPLKTIAGQPRASAALKLGAQIRGKGYNIFVTGLSATGRSAAVKQIFEGMKLRVGPGTDHCYVNNFVNPESPRLITMPRGKGRKFKEEMSKLLDSLKRTIPHSLEDETVLQMKRELAEKYANLEAGLFKKLEAKVSKAGFALVQVQMGPYTRPDVFPVIDGNPVPPNQVGKLVEEGKFPKDKIDELYQKYQGYKADLRAVLKRVRALNREMIDKTEDIEVEILEEILKDYCQDLADDFNQEPVEKYLCEIREYILKNPDIFTSDESDQQQHAQPMPIPMPVQMDESKYSDPFQLFQVNVVHDAMQEVESPIIVEHHPNYLNLFGTIEREWRPGGYWTSDFTKISGGSLLAADGGYLVLNAMDVLQETLSWRTLMRTLKTGKLQIQGIDTLLSVAPASLKPEPIDIDVTVILIGDNDLYHLLSYYEEDFHRVFKVRADFDSLMSRNKKQINYYSMLASKMNSNEGTLHLKAKAVGRLAEHGAKLGGHGDKMSARLGEIADIIREASHHAKSLDRKLVDADHIELALKEMEYRQDLVRERIDEAFEEDILMVDTEGEAVGQINGLAVHGIGAFAFGRPQRITCEVSMGDSGVVNIEREAKLSGKIHDKGVLILEGYLRHLYGMEGPIGLSASLCFEQSYSNIDGDSASMAEALILLSELSNLPVRQDLAITGSINQKGEVQAIGGVNYKIEGFFRVCEKRGLTGTQGVVIPRANVKELMLPDEILAAIAAGNFRIIPVSTVNQALEAFTGIKAGRRQKAGGFTRGSVHDRVDQTLADFYWAGKSPGEREEAVKECKGRTGRRSLRRIQET